MANKIVKSFGPYAVLIDEKGVEQELFEGMEVYPTDTVIGDVEYEEVPEEVDAEVAALQEAILAGIDPTEVTEPTAAGAPAAGEGVQDSGGSSFVTLDRTNGEIDPYAGYETTTFSSEFDNPEEQPPLTIALEEVDTIPLPVEDEPTISITPKDEEPPVVPDEPVDEPEPEEEPPVVEPEEEPEDEDEDDPVDPPVVDPEPEDEEDDSTGQNPGNDKDVGNSPHDGNKGNSNDDESPLDNKEDKGDEQSDNPEDESSEDEPKEPESPEDGDGSEVGEDNNSEEDIPDTSTGQNPGNDKNVGNSKFDGNKGASNDDEGPRDTDSTDSDSSGDDDVLSPSDLLDDEETLDDLLPKGKDKEDNPNKGKDNGWGNGDDEAPGGSLDHNNAENNLDGLLSPTEQYYDN